MPVGEREILARLEFPIIRQVLVIGADLVDAFTSGLAESSTINTHLFDDFPSDEKSRCIRVLVECCLFWQLRLYGIRQTFVSAIHIFIFYEEYLRNLMIG